jgi:hypothetical protein
MSCKCLYIYTQHTDACKDNLYKYIDYAVDFIQLFVYLNSRQIHAEKLCARIQIMQYVSYICVYTTQHTDTCKDIVAQVMHALCKSSAQKMFTFVVTCTWLFVTFFVEPIEEDGASRIYVPLEQIEGQKSSLQERWRFLSKFFSSEVGAKLVVCMYV